MLPALAALGPLDTLSSQTDVLLAVDRLEALFKTIPLTTFDELDGAHLHWRPRKCAALAVGYLIEKCGNPRWHKHRMFIVAKFGPASSNELLLAGYALAKLFDDHFQSRSK